LIETGIKVIDVMRPLRRLSGGADPVSLFIL
jgi:F0F1-type ATP synthase beta subunit